MDGSVTKQGSGSELRIGTGSDAMADDREIAETSPAWSDRPAYAAEPTAIPALIKRGE